MSSPVSWIDDEEEEETEDEEAKAKCAAALLAITSCDFLVSIREPHDDCERCAALLELDRLEQLIKAFDMAMAMQTHADECVATEIYLIKNKISEGILSFWKESRSDTINVIKALLIVSES